MLDQAISAISCVFLGKLDSDARMLQHGVQLYGSAIWYMSRHLERRIYNCELLYVSVIFQELEVMSDASVQTQQIYLPRLRPYTVLMAWRLMSHMWLD